MIGNDSAESLNVFLDSNMIIYISQFKKYDVVTWVNSLYNKIYVHVDVLDELILSEPRDLCTKQIEQSNWILFNPENSDILNDDQFEIYNSFYSEIRFDFKNFQLSRDIKQTTDKGDIAILAGCRTLSIAVVSTQDGDFEKVIRDNNYIVNAKEDESGIDTLIQVHDLEELGLLCIINEITTFSKVKKFISAVMPSSKKRLISNLESKIKVYKQIR